MDNSIVAVKLYLEVLLTSMDTVYISVNITGDLFKRDDAVFYLFSHLAEKFHHVSGNGTETRVAVIRLIPYDYYLAKTKGAPPDAEERFSI